MIQNIKQSGFGCFLAWLVTLSPETERLSIVILYIIQYVHHLRLKSTNGSWYRLLLSYAFPVSRCLVYVYKSGSMPPNM